VGWEHRLSLRRDRGLPRRAGAAIVRVLHAQLSCAGGGRNGWGERTTLGPFQWRGGARQSLRCAVFIRRNRGDAGLQVLRNFSGGVAMLTKRIIACLDVTAGRVVKRRSLRRSAGCGRSCGAGASSTPWLARMKLCCSTLQRHTRGAKTLVDTVGPHGAPRIFRAVHGGRWSAHRR